MPNKNIFKSQQEYLKYYREYREKNRKKLRKYNREYNKKWRKKNGYHSEYNSRKKYPLKELARHIFNYAIRKGKIKRDKCSVCGGKNAQGHHEDYFKPLEVIWLCPLHHKERHKKLFTTP